MNRGPSTRPVAIVGASCRAAAQCAARAGWFPIAADRFADRDLRACAEVHPFENFDLHARAWAVRFPDLPVVLAGGMENQPELVDRLRALGMRIGLDAAMLQTLRDPEKWSLWARSTGLKWPRTDSQSTHVIPTSLSSDWLKKSRNGVGGLHVSQCSAGMTLEPGDYFQEHLQGESIGVTFLSDGRSNHWIGCTASWSADDFAAPGPYVYRGSVGPIALDAQETHCLSDFGALVRQESGLRGLWQADLIRNQDGLWLLEINPRWSASMELLDAALGLPLVSLHVGAIGNETTSTRNSHQASMAIGKCIVYATRDITHSHAQLETWWSRRWTGETERLDSGVAIADIPNSRDVIPGGYPILTCLAAHQDRNELANRLRRAAARVLNTCELA